MRDRNTNRPPASCQSPSSWHMQGELNLELTVTSETLRKIGTYLGGGETRKSSEFCLKSRVEDVESFFQDKET